MATMQEANNKVQMVDMKTFDIFTETSDDWAGKYAPDASGHYKNPKTGEYTVVKAMKCASCGQLIPVPDIPADLLPVAPPEGRRVKMAEMQEANIRASEGDGDDESPPRVQMPEMREERVDPGGAAQ